MTARTLILFKTARIDTETNFIIDGDDMLLIGYDKLARWAFADRKDRAGCANHAHYRSLLKDLGIQSPWDLIDKPEPAVKSEELETEEEEEEDDDLSLRHVEGCSKIECVDLLDSDSEHEGAQLKVPTPRKQPTVRSKSSTPEMTFCSPS